MGSPRNEACISLGNEIRTPLRKSTALNSNKEGEFPMVREQRMYDKPLRVYRLETQTAVSVSEFGIHGQIVWAQFIPLRNESTLRSALESAELTPGQVGYALQELARTTGDSGFSIRIDQSQPHAGEPLA